MRVAFAAAVLSLVFVGCGGDASRNGQSMTLEQYLCELQILLAEVEAAGATATEPSDFSDSFDEAQVEIVEHWDSVYQAFNNYADGLREATPPVAAKDVHERLVRLFDEQARALGEAKDLVSETSSFEDLSNLDDDLDKLLEVGAPDIQAAVAELDTLAEAQGITPAALDCERIAG